MPAARTVAAAAARAAAASHSAAALAFLPSSSAGVGGGGGGAAAGAGITAAGRLVTAHHLHFQQRQRRRLVPSPRLLPLALTWLTTLFSSSARTGGGPDGSGRNSSSGTGGVCLGGLGGSSGIMGENMTTDDMAAAIRRLVPPLSSGLRKGQMGRIGVLGGSGDFTGAPYYAGMSSLKVGGDLSYILTAEEASGPIKGYSPELMVTPVYSAKELCGSKAPSFAEKGAREAAVAAMVARVTAFFPKLHVLVIGPGLGRDPWVLEATRRVIVEARSQALPLVIDADGLWLVAQDPSVVKGFPDGCPVVLTPNLVEFARLQAGIRGDAIATAVPAPGEARPGHEEVMALARSLGGKVTVCLKGPADVIADGERWLVVGEPGALRRSGGLGDILAGTMGVLVHWARLALPLTDADTDAEGKAAAGSKGPVSAGAAAGMDPRDRALWACAAASVIVRRASRAAFAEKRRSMTAPDAIAHLGAVLEELAPTQLD